MDAFLRALRDLKHRRVELSRALHLLGSDLMEIEQKVLAGQTSIRVHTDLIPKVLQYTEAADAFTLEIKEALRTGLLLDVQDELNISA